MIELMTKVSIYMINEPIVGCINHLSVNYSSHENEIFNNMTSLVNKFWIMALWACTMNKFAV